MWIGKAPRIRAICRCASSRATGSEQWRFSSNRRTVPGQQQRFEELVENCAFFVWELADRDARMWVRSQRFALALPEEGEIYDLLRFLALVEPLVLLKPDDQPVEGPVDAANLQIVFSALPDAAEEVKASGSVGSRVVG